MHPLQNHWSVCVGLKPAGSQTTNRGKLATVEDSQRKEKKAVMCSAVVWESGGGVLAAD